MLLQTKAVDVKHPVHYVTRKIIVYRRTSAPGEPQKAKKRRPVPKRKEVIVSRQDRSMFYVAVTNGWQGVAYMVASPSSAWAPQHRTNGSVCLFACVVSRCWTADWTD